MGNIQNLVVISEGFPNPKCPYRYTFLEQVVTGFADLGMSVTVICPVYNTQKQYHYLDYWEYKSKKGNLVRVYQPRIINYSVKQLGVIKLGKLTYKSFKSAVFELIKKYKIIPDAIYSHFMFPAGCVAAELGEYLSVKSFCACGESCIDDFIKPVGVNYVAERLSRISGIIAVSSENKRVILEKKLAPNSPIVVFPNGVDHNLFRPMDKQKCRDKLGLSASDYVGIFVGGFNENKGVNRVSEAASRVRDLKMIYIGANGKPPTKGDIVFCGKVAHDLIPDYLNAADVFILPTRAEGCCNAIIEAMACGLPIVSSDRPFNYDILSRDIAILIEPNDIDDMEKALLSLRDNNKRLLLSAKSLVNASRFSISERVKLIYHFMAECKL